MQRRRPATRSPGRGDRRAAAETDGLVVVDKELGCTSHDVVAACRRTFGLRRVGHAGTLDPDATGVLLVGLGRGTRLLRFASQLGKSYIGEVVLGEATSTLDAAGEVTARFDMSHVTPEEVRVAALALTGRISQVPPMVSAVKIGGRRLHELAREGVEVERPPRSVNVTRFEVEETAQPNAYRVEVDCSAGTYVRVLAADLGAALGGGAHLRRLRRNAVGSFTAAEAAPLSELGADRVLPMSEIVRDYNGAEVDGELLAAVRFGRVLDRTTLGVAGIGPWPLSSAEGALVAMYEAAGAERVKPAVVLEPLGGGGQARF